MQRLWRRFVPIWVLLILLGLTVYLSLGPLPWVVVYGDSMEPTLSQGDVVQVEPIDPATIEEGDIIVVDVPPPGCKRSTATRIPSSIESSR